MKNVTYEKYLFRYCFILIGIKDFRKLIISPVKELRYRYKFIFSFPNKFTNHLNI